MNNTALRAEAQSANNTHMVFANEEHEKFYYEKLEQARYQDCYHKALIYILGISEDTMEAGYGILKHEEGIDLMPGNIELSGLEVSLVNVMSREIMLRSYVDRIKDG